MVRVIHDKKDHLLDICKINDPIQLFFIFFLKERLPTYQAVSSIFKVQILSLYLYQVIYVIHLIITTVLVSGDIEDKITVGVATAVIVG